MDPKVLLEIFGYVGSGLVVVSMMMKSVKKLRIINMCGSVISAIYAAIVPAYPLMLMNICLIAINAYHLIRSYREEGSTAKETATEISTETGDGTDR